MAGLDAHVALALMTKAELVFGQPGQVLAFPVGGTSWLARNLNFLPDDADADAMRAALKGLSDFSTLANLLPQGRVWLSAAGRADLPQVYRRVLEQAQVAELLESSEAREQLATARAVLVTVAADDPLSDTVFYAAYKQYRDAYYLTLQQYNAAKYSGELGGSAASSKAWAAEEPTLRGARDQALMDWQLLGHRKLVEDAQATVVALSKRAPLATWSEWDTRSQPGVGTVADLTGLTFWPCYISPANACEVGWQRMVLSRNEVKALQDRAPHELKARLGVGGADLKVLELEFEFTSAKLHRPWFDSEVFASRFWRARPPAAIQLSTGHEPFIGDCSLYASAVVFFRNISATVEGDPPAAQAKLDAPDVDLAPFAVRWAELHKPELSQPIVKHPAVADPGPEILVHQQWPHALDYVGKGGAGLGGSGLGGAALLHTHALSGHGLGALHNQGHNALLAKALQQQAALHAVQDPEPVSLAKFSQQKKVLAKRLMLRDVAWKPSTPPPAKSPPQVGTSQLQTAAEDIFVLAWICTVVPASPNPDPSLAWGDTGSVT